MAGSDGVLGVISIRGSNRLGPSRLEIHSASSRWRLDLWTQAERRALLQLLPAAKTVTQWYGRSWGGFWYRGVDGAEHYWSDPRDSALFLTDHGPELCSLVRSVARHPNRRYRSRNRRLPFGSPIDVEGTARLLRRKPELLVRDPNGILTLGEHRYMPAQVVVRRRTHDVNTIENRRLKALLNRLIRDVDFGIRSGIVPGDSIAASNLSAVRQLLSLSFLSSLSRVRLPGPAEPRTERERNDDRYARLARLREVYLSALGLGEMDLSWRRHQPRDHEVYQAWCVYAVAKAFGMKPTGVHFRPRSPGGPLFESDQADLYHEAVGVLASWRNGTAVPDDYRPDIVWTSQFDDKVILIDAKYSIGTDGSLPPGRIKEVQAYMQSFGITKACILYPGHGVDGGHIDVSNGGYLVRLVPLVPNGNDTGDWLEALREMLLECRCYPGEDFVARNPRDTVQ